MSKESSDDIRRQAQCNAQKQDFSRFHLQTRLSDKILQLRSPRPLQKEAMNPGDVAEHFVPDETQNLRDIAASFGSMDRGHSFADALLRRITAGKHAYSKNQPAYNEECEKKNKHAHGYNLNGSRLVKTSKWTTLLRRPEVARRTSVELRWR